MSCGITLGASSSETAALHCYSGQDDVPQDIDVADVRILGQYLRSYGRKTPGGRFLTMMAHEAPDCAEWTLYAWNTALALAKHIGSGNDSSVLYEDIATTIDGGLGASDGDKEEAIVGCLTAGGSLGVLVNETNPSYRSRDYINSGHTPDGILVKIVSNARKDDL